MDEAVAMRMRVVCALCFLCVRVFVLRERVPVLRVCGEEPYN